MDTMSEHRVRIYIIHYESLLHKHDFVVNFVVSCSLHKFSYKGTMA